MQRQSLSSPKPTNTNKQLNYQLQEMAFQKYPFEINNKTFFCLESYFEDQLLNGVDLDLKQSKGISIDPQTVSYMSHTQDLILSVGSNIVAYNIQKRAYMKLCEIHGYVHLIRTYHCKISNRAFIYWLESDQEGSNSGTVRNAQMMGKVRNRNTRNDNDDQIEEEVEKSNKQGQKLPSVWNLFDKKLIKNKEKPNQKNQNSEHHESPSKGYKEEQHQENRQINKNDKNLNKKSGILISKKKIQEQVRAQDEKPSNDKAIPAKKKQKTVRILPPAKHSHASPSSQTKKKFRLCIYDFQKHIPIHKQPIQIFQHQKITQILLFYTSQKIVGYIINDLDYEDQDDQPTFPAPSSKIYYKKIHIDDSIEFTKPSTTKYLNWDRNQHRQLQQQQQREQQESNYGHSFQSLYVDYTAITQVKYNGETDQYLFVADDRVTLHSIQMTQKEHQGIYERGEGFFNERGSHRVVVSSGGNVGSSVSINLLQSQQQQIAEQQENILSKEIEKVTNKLITTSTCNLLRGASNGHKNASKYKLEIIEQLSLSSLNTIKVTSQPLSSPTGKNVRFEQPIPQPSSSQTVIRDFSMNEIYLAILIPTGIHFYSIFNLNTILFKYEFPPQLYHKQILHQHPVSKIELNKTYVLITHENSTLVSSFSIMERKLKYNSTCEIDIENCHQQSNPNYCTETDIYKSQNKAMGPQQSALQNNNGVLRLFMNGYNCQVAVLARQHHQQGRLTTKNTEGAGSSSKQIIPLSSSVKSQSPKQSSPIPLALSNLLFGSPGNSLPQRSNTYIDLHLTYINFSGLKCQTKPLHIKQQPFKNILTCKWHSSYLIQTENQIIAKQWVESFDNIKCSTLHPTGQYLIIGFNDCFKIYAVTQQGLQNTYMSDGVKECHSICYSEMGEHFAVGSSNMIHVYNSYNCFKLQTIVLPVGSIVEKLEYTSGLKGTINKSPIGNGISGGSSKLVCVLMRSKKVLVYDVLLRYKEILSYSAKNFLNENKHELMTAMNSNSSNGRTSQKQKTQFSHSQSNINHNLLTLTIKGLAMIEISSLFLDLQLQVLIFSCNRKLFFINLLTNQSLGCHQCENITSMLYNKNLSTLFLGTINGEIIAFPWPNKPSNIMSELPKFKLHSDKITTIKITSDYKYLITISNTDKSMYKCHLNYVLNLKRLKGPEIVEYKGGKSTAVVNSNGGPSMSNGGFSNFLYSKGLCQYSHSQNIEKLENTKELEQEAVNTVFMLPQERHKQKEKLFMEISQNKEELIDENYKEFQPLHIESQNLRNNIIKIKEDLEKNSKFYQKEIKRQKQNFNVQNSKMLKLYSELNYQMKMLHLDLQEDLGKVQYTLNKDLENTKKQNQKKYQEYESKLKETQAEKKIQATSFLQVNLIEEQKRKFLGVYLQPYIRQIQQMTEKNGRISCNNSNLEKQIHILKYRIEELKFVIINANSSIEKLKSKQTLEEKQRVTFEKLLYENSKINVAEMEKKYIKVTKELIEKNKEIDINLNQYEKEKEILNQLEKTVDTLEHEIDKMVENFQAEKRYFKILEDKYSITNERLNELIKKSKNNKVTKSRTKILLQKFLQSLEEISLQHQESQSKNEHQKEVEGVFDVVGAVKRLNDYDEQEIFKVMGKGESSKKSKTNRENNRHTTSTTDRVSTTHSTKKTKQRKNREQQQQYNQERNEKQKFKSAFTQLLNPHSKPTTAKSSSKNKKVSSKKVSYKENSDIKNSASYGSSFQVSRNEKTFKSVEKSSCRFDHQNDKDGFLNSTARHNRDGLALKINHNKFKLQKESIGCRKNKNLFNATVTERFTTTSPNEAGDIFAKMSQKKYQNQIMKTEGCDERQPSSTQRFQAHHLSSSKNKPLSPTTILKAKSIEEKFINKINNEKRMFLNSKKRFNIQNQDLIKTYNSLTSDNKNFRNIMKAYETNLDEDDKNYIFAATSQRGKPNDSNKMISMMSFDVETGGWKNKTKNVSSSTGRGFDMTATGTTAKNGVYGSYGMLKAKTESDDKDFSLGRKETPFEKYTANKEAKMNDVIKYRRFQNEREEKEELISKQLGAQVSGKAKNQIKKRTFVKAAHSEKRLTTLPCFTLEL